MIRSAPRLFLVGIGALIPLAGCSNDFGLETAPDLSTEGLGVPAFNPGGSGGPDGPVTPPQLPSPWDDIRPGTLPEVYLAVAHNEYDCDNMDGRGQDPDWDEDLNVQRRFISDVVLIVPPPE
jgi:hypothetical protein